MFIKELAKLCDISSSISDKDLTFLSLFWMGLFKQHGTTLNMSTTYHPKIDGQAEESNKTLETYLRCFSLKSLKARMTSYPGQNTGTTPVSEDQPNIPHFK